MVSIGRPILIAIIVIIVLIAGSSFFLGTTFGRKTTTVTSSGTTQTYTTTTSTTVTTTAATATYTSTVTVSGTPGLVDASGVFSGADPSVVTVIAYDSNLNPLDLGSGFVYDSQGHVVTNDHVVSGGRYFQIETSDFKFVTANVIGEDQYADIAVLEASALSSVKPLQLSSTFKIGELAFAMGSPLGLTDTITSGIVSQVNRTGISAIPMLQTDAAINPGNSGGPLLNAAGEVIGINTAGIPSNTSELIGFAIPSDVVSKIVPKLIQSGKYNHPVIGIGGGYMDPFIAKKENLKIDSGFLITTVQSGSPASNSGLRVGDIVIKIDNYNISHDPDIDYLMAYIYSPNQSVTFTVNRNGNEVQVQLVLGTM
jgi:2-alkenal reductase